MDPAHSYSLLNRRATYLDEDEPDRAIELDPGDAESYYERGMVRMGLGQYRKAIEDFDHCIGLNPSNEFVSHDRQIAVERAEAEGGLTRHGYMRVLIAGRRFPGILRRCLRRSSGNGSRSSG